MMKEQKKQPLLILTGPTAVGKTDLSIALAKKINGAVISADSMQVYRGMDIGSAKVTPEEMQGVKHYLIDVLDPEDEFHVVRFQEMAKAALKEIYANGQIPIIAGGTGFYIQALLYDIDFTEQEEDTALREHYAALAQEYGNEYLHEMLRRVDPVSAEIIHANNVKRTIRALEYFEKTGEPISRHNEQERAKESPYDFRYFVLTDERVHLYERIDRRVDMMLEAGLVDEVKRLRDQGCHKGMVSMQGLGYKEILSWLEGEISYEEAVYLLKRDTRHFAKRQLTWFRRERDVIWLNKPDYDYDDSRILDEILNTITAGGWL
ncbi:tRNA (adenosine(37)-N6)-dimethylallyltransferase MiaA [uncultured Eubacterium sp.]|uniref:tRNA (adenosine(37)-N6)-dimethylallyltransferase MiaA n=1 Tax=uncultured Eubacterium sp. TaxID=165185 RepID=UPI003418BC5F